MNPTTETLALTRYDV